MREEKILLTLLFKKLFINIDVKVTDCLKKYLGGNLKVVMRKRENELKPGEKKLGQK